MGTRPRPVAPCRFNSIKQYIEQRMGANAGSQVGVGDGIMPVDREDRGSIVWLTMNNPSRLNALSMPMRLELIGHLRDIRADQNVRCLVITGAGTSFCAGADISDSHGVRDYRSARHTIRNASQVYIPLLTDLEIPVIAAVRGHAAGVGWSIALAADVIVAADNAKFTSAFGRIGLAPDGGLVWHLMRAVGIYAAKDIVLRARTIDATEARSLGLVTQLVSQEELQDAVETIAKEYANGPTVATAMAKKQFHNAMFPPMSAFIEQEALMQPGLHTTEDSVEGPIAFREKRKPVFKGR